MNCPVCNDQNTPEGAESCNNCGSNLRAFHDIQRVRKQRGNYKTVSIALGLLALLAIVFLASSSVMKDTETPRAETTMVVAETPSASNAELEELHAQLAERNDEIAMLKDEVNELITTMQSSHDDLETTQETIHIVQEGESLWSISEMYHGHGFQHAEIAGHNGVEDIHHIEIGDTIIIKH